MNIDKQKESSQNLDILEIPYKFKNIEDFNLIKTNDNRYELKLSQKLDSKKTISNFVIKDKKFILIRNKKIINQTDKLFVFDIPIDFIIPQDIQFYEFFFKEMMRENSENKFDFVNSDSINKNNDFIDPLNKEGNFLNKNKLKGPVNKKSDYLNGDTDFTNYFNKNINFPEYFPPTLSFNHCFQNYNFKNLKNKKDSNRKFKVINELSKNEKQKLILKLKKQHGEIEFKDIYDKLKDFFSREKIVRTKKIKIETKFDLTQIKKYLKLFATFKTSGPWRKSWIKNNFDPTKYFESFKSQKIILNRRGKEICLNDHPFLIHELEQNEKKYLKRNCDENGFLTEEGIDFINLHFDQSIVSSVFKEPEMPLENDDESDFLLDDEI